MTTEKLPTWAQARCMLNIRDHGTSGTYGARHVLHRCVERSWVRIVGRPPKCGSRLTAAGRRALARVSGRYPDLRWEAP